MTVSFDDVQRIVLRGSAWSAGAHLALEFTDASMRCGFLSALKSTHGLTAVGMKKPTVQVSLGFSRRGLQRLRVPPNVMACFAMKSPAFFEGAPLRASRELGASGDNVPRFWDEAFDFRTLDAVLSVHAMSPQAVANAVEHVGRIASKEGVKIRRLPDLARLPIPAERLHAGVTEDSGDQYLHFGFRDSLSTVGIEGVTRREVFEACLKTSRHAAGEFVLGHRQDSGANPWIAGPGPRVWPQELRNFFLGGSFGVLHQVEQDVDAFDRFVTESAESLRLGVDELKTKLCGRRPDGRSPAVEADQLATADFDYKFDPDGVACPFGSHVRRMNPRGGAVVEGGRTRALLRRGMPYTCEDPNAKCVTQRGLVGHFFCASIEDQFEHLLGQWADRVPLGSQDGGSARDPLVGAHAPGDGPFHIPMGRDRQPLVVTGLFPFTRTRGTAYLFYPSLPTFEGIAEECLWGADDQDNA